MTLPINNITTNINIIGWNFASSVPKKRKSLLAFLGFQDPADKKEAAKPDYLKDHLPIGGRIKAENGITIIEHTVSESEMFLSDVAFKYFEFAETFSFGRFMDEIRAANDLKSDFLHPGQILMIPDIIQISADEMKPRQVPSSFVPRGIYLNGDLVSSEKVPNIVDQMVQADCNTLIFDVKDTDGYVRFDTSSKLAKEMNSIRATIPLFKLISYFKKKNIHSCARIALFRDDRLSHKRTDLRLYKSGSVDGKEQDNWVDPSLDEVINFNLEIALEMAKAGVDEINFDYLRFPGTGNIEGYDKNRVEMICKFLKKAKDMLKPYGVRISVDVLAVKAWKGNEFTVNGIGQDLVEIAKYVDAIYLMAYASHFDSIPGIANPADKPYEIVLKTAKYAVEKLRNTQVKVYVFLAGFTHKNIEFLYGPKYAYEELKGAADGGIKGTVFWNKGGYYYSVFEGYKRFNLTYTPNN